MLKKITFGGLFLFATLLISTVAQSRSTATPATIDSTPKAPVGQGFCPMGIRCSTGKIDLAPKAPVGHGLCIGRC
jgi:hypothetical protein